MGFGLLHLSTYLPILELKIVCPIWHLFRFTKVAISKSNFCQMWEKFAIFQFSQFRSYQRLPNSVHAHYNSDGCHIWQESQSILCFCMTAYIMGFD